MARYIDVLELLLGRIAGGEIAAGAPIPSVRALARSEGIAPATAARVHAELVRAGIASGGARRRSVVTPDAAVRARRMLSGGRALRLAGSDDPLLDRLLAGRSDVDRAAARGSFSGLSALWSGGADAATLHLRHRDGTYNAPFARAVLRDRRPQLVPLWRREQGLLLAAGNPRGVGSVASLGHCRVALRAPGTGTRALLDRLVVEAGADPGALRGAVYGSHLEVATAVASGAADAGVATCAAAMALGLEFVPLAWEPFELALPRDALELAEPLVAAIRERAPQLAAALGGYELMA